MTRSDDIAALAASMAKAQAEITGATKSHENPHFRSRYADLASVWDACRGPLTKHGLAIIQWPRLAHLGGEAWALELETVLTHTSGQWMADTLAVVLARLDAQSIGSAITYARRFSLGAVAGVAPDDDDGEAATSASTPRVVGKSAPAATAPAPTAVPPPAPGPAPADEVERATGKVLGIVARKVANGERFVITLSNQHTYATFQRRLAETAKLAREAGTEVEIQYKATRYGNEAVAIVDLSQPEPEL